MRRQGSLEPEHLATLTWSAIRLTSKDVKGEEHVALDDLNGYVLPKQMLAIMGPSGSGKTALLDVLAGRVHKSATLTGKILLNGRQSNLSYGVSSYVTQDEVLMGILSVRETIMYSALLRLPSSMPRTEKEARVDAVISEMGLTDAQNTKIGNWFLKGVSGGQKRRVAIACELVTAPTLLFLDEPTSGLDAAAAYHVMELIRRLSQGNRTILTVIHQPSSEVFELFDQLTLLSAGKMVYFGPARDALTMFEAAGLPCPPMRAPTDHFLHVINQDFQGTSHSVDVVKNNDALQHRFTSTLRDGVLEAVERHSSPHGREYKGTTNQANYFYQTWLLTHRNLVNNWRNVGVFWLRLGMYLMLSICIGTIYLQLGYSWSDTYSRAGMLMFTLSFLTFMSISGFPAFVEDMNVFLQERLNGYYQVSSFAIANTLGATPFIFGIAITCSLVMYWLVGLNDEGDRFPYFFLTLFACLMAAESLMMAIAAIVPHYLMGIAGGAGILGMFMLVAGFLQPVPNIPKPVWLYPLHFIAYHSYGFAGFMLNEFENTDGWGCACAAQEGGCVKTSPNAPDCTAQGNDVLDYWLGGPVADLKKWDEFGILIGMSVGYRVIFWALLVLKEKIST